MGRERGEGRALLTRREQCHIRWEFTEFTNNAPPQWCRNLQISGRNQCDTTFLVVHGTSIHVGRDLDDSERRFRPLLAAERERKSRDERGERVTRSSLGRYRHRFSPRNLWFFGDGQRLFPPLSLSCSPELNEVAGHSLRPCSARGMRMRGWSEMHKSLSCGEREGK